MREARIAPLLLALGVACGSPAQAFHEGGVATCGACHVMHGEGAAAAAGPLLMESPSDLCLSCHADDAGRVLGEDPLLPPPELGGGNFVFLTEDNLNDAADGLTNPIPGDAAGHNVVAPAHGLVADPLRPAAPGGSYPADQLHCTSCHDPHGTAGFRMLRGIGPVAGGVAEFAFPAPTAEGLPLDGAGESRGRHTAYRAGVSDWCANCHGRYHDAGESELEHPSDEELDPEILDRYNAYDGDADPAGGVPALAYLPEVPFEDPAARTDATAGPTPVSRVMCLTCHRAHASSAPAAGRWDFGVALLGQDGAISGSWAIPSPYPDPSQGTLCSKCHEGAPD